MLELVSKHRPTILTRYGHVSILKTLLANHALSTDNNKFQLTNHSEHLNGTMLSMLCVQKPYKTTTHATTY